MNIETNESSDLSFHTYLRGIILIGFALLILGLILTDNIKYYIAPKMMPFIYFGLVVFLLLGIIQILRSMSKRQSDFECDCGADHQVTGPTWLKIIIYVVFILPILMGFIIPDQVLNSSVAANRGIIYNAGNNVQQEFDSQITSKSSTPRTDRDFADPDVYFASENDIEHNQIEDLYDEDWLDEYYDEQLKLYESESYIYVDNDNYLDIMVLLDLHLDKFIGKEIDMGGFVFREDDFEDNQFVVARFAITCCTADAGVYGTLVEAEEAQYYDDDTWIRVRGTITETEYHGYRLPVIQMREIRIIDEPDSPYVYQEFL